MNNNISCFRKNDDSEPQFKILRRQFVLVCGKGRLEGSPMDQVASVSGWSTATDTLEESGALDSANVSSIAAHVAIGGTTPTTPRR